MNTAANTSISSAGQKATPGASTPTSADPPTGWRPPAKSIFTIIVVIALAIGAILLVLAAWNLPPFAHGVERTNNAYVRGRTTVIAPQVSGYVSEVKVGDFQEVKADQILVQIDDRIYRARVEQANASLNSQLAALANVRQTRASRTAALQSQIAALASARAQLLKAKADMARVDDLVKDGSVSVRERDQTVATLRQTEAQVEQANAAGEVAREDIRAVDVSKDGLQAQVDAARAQLQLAQIDLDHTVIRAPEAGQLGEIGVRAGQYVTNGTQLLSLVPPDRWVIANFKEEQTGRMQVGQNARFTVDALPGISFTGHVEETAPAAGSEFSVLKPDNATGNFVKVPQRIGVRIALDPNQPESSALKPGMSVEIQVRGRSER